MYKANGLSNEQSHPDIGIVDDSVMVRAGVHPHIGGSDSDSPGADNSNEGDPPEHQADENASPDSADSNHVRFTGAGLGEQLHHVTGVVVGVEGGDRVSSTGAGVGEQIPTSSDHHEPLASGEGHSGASGAAGDSHSGNDGKVDGGPWFDGSSRDGSDNKDGQPDPDRDDGSADNNQPQLGHPDLHRFGMGGALYDGSEQQAPADDGASGTDSHRISFNNAVVQAWLGDGTDHTQDGDPQVDHGDDHSSGNSGEASRLDDGSGARNDNTDSHRMSFTGAGIGEHIATASDHHLPQNDWCEDDCNNPDADKTDIVQVSFNDAVIRAGFVDGDNWNAGDRPQADRDGGGTGSGLNDPDPEGDRNHNPDVFQPMPLGTVHYTGAGIGDRLGESHEPPHLVLPHPTGIVASTDAGVAGHEVNWAHDGAIAADGNTFEDRSEALADVTSFLSSAHNADGAPSDTFSGAADNNFGPGSEQDFSGDPQDHHEEGDGATNSGDSNGTDGSGTPEDGNDEPKDVDPPGPTDDMPNPEGGPGNPNSTPDPDSAGEGGEGGGARIVVSASTAHASAGNSEQSGSNGGGSHSPGDPGEEMPNPDGGGNSPSSNVAHGLSFWDQAASATQGVTTGLHVGASAISDATTVNHGAYDWSAASQAHDGSSALADSSAHTVSVAHDVAAAGAELHGELGTSTLHDALTLSSGSFATQMHV